VGVPQRWVSPRPAERRVREDPADGPSRRAHHVGGRARHGQQAGGGLAGALPGAQPGGLDVRAHLAAGRRAGGAALCCPAWRGLAHGTGHGVGCVAAGPPPGAAPGATRYRVAAGRPLSAGPLASLASRRHHRIVCPPVVAGPVPCPTRGQGTLPGGLGYLRRLGGAQQVAGDGHRALCCVGPLCRHSRWTPSPGVADPLRADLGRGRCGDLCVGVARHVGAAVAYTDYGAGNGHVLRRDPPLQRQLFHGRDPRRSWARLLPGRPGLSTDPVDVSGRLARTSSGLAAQ